MKRINGEMVFEELHLFCGSGGGALGFQQAQHEFKGIRGRFETICGIDVDPLCCIDFERLTGSPAVQMDLFDRQQYIDFWDKEPPANWKEVTPDDIRKACNARTPDGIFLSPPCKGFSGLLPEKTSKSPKYQALNRLVTRSIFLTVEAFRDDLPAFILLENVPRIKSRGKALLNEVTAMLKQYGYVFHKEDYDCGEWGQLGQTRKRFLLMARNPQKISSFVYEPIRHKLKSIGEILGPLPMPGDIEKAGKMHRIPNLAYKTWERLALIPAGKDWRALNDLKHSPRNGAWRIVPFEETSPTITGSIGVGKSNGISGIADPRTETIKGYGNKYRVVGVDEVAPTITSSILGSGAPIYADPKVPQFAANANKVHKWEEHSGTVTGGAGVSNGGIVIADPRTEHPTWRRTSITKVQDWEEPSGVVMGSVNYHGAGSGIVADPRLPEREKRYSGLYKVVEWDKSTPTVIGQTDIQSGALSVSDPRFRCKQRSGTMKVTLWDETAKTITSGNIYNSASAVADPRIPTPDDKGVFIIIAADGTWHRPITTFEMAMLQGLPADFPDGSPLVLAGNSEKIWREHIGNMVPPPTACAIGTTLLATMMPNYMGEWHWGFSDDKIWVSSKTTGDSTVKYFS